LKDRGIHFISVGHRASILDYHNYVLDLQGPDAWRLLPVKDYQDKTANA
jgi:putative ATP-binding cassette transporter